MADITDKEISNILDAAKALRRLNYFSDADKLDDILRGIRSGDKREKFYIEAEQVFRSVYFSSEHANAEYRMAQAVRAVVDRTLSDASELAD